MYVLICDNFVKNVNDMYYVIYVNVECELKKFCARVVGNQLYFESFSWLWKPFVQDFCARIVSIGNLCLFYKIVVSGLWSLAASIIKS